jgi:hypothetical protein
VERIGGSGFGFGGVDLRVAVHPECLDLTSLTGASPCWVLARVNILVCSLVPRFADVSSLGLFGAREVRFLDLGFPA